jgi:hypothetical protein
MRGISSKIAFVASEDGFLNVDLEIGARSRSVLTPLMERFNGRLFEMYAGRIRGFYRAHYENTRRLRRYNPTGVIHELADAVEGLDAPARRAWNAASLRDFNVGVEVARGVWGAQHVIEPDALRRVAALQGRIVFTVYQPPASTQRMSRT